MSDVNLVLPDYQEPVSTERRIRPPQMLYACQPTSPAGWTMLKCIVSLKGSGFRIDKLADWMKTRQTCNHSDKEGAGAH